MPKLISVYNSLSQSHLSLIKFLGDLEQLTVKRFTKFAYFE